MRLAFAIVSLLCTLIALAVTLTVPMIASTGPALLTVALGVLTFVVWPKGRNRKRAEA